MSHKYRRIDKPVEQLPSNEIRVKHKVGIGRYLKRAHDLLETEGAEQIIIKGVSNAVDSAVKLAELVKHRVKGLHQNNSIGHITIVDEYEPLEEGLDHLKFSRIVTMLQIVLSKKELDTSDIGYQEPIDETEVQEYNERPEPVDQIEGGDGKRGQGRKRRNRRPRNFAGGDRNEGEEGSRPRGGGRGPNDRQKETEAATGDPKEGDKPVGQRRRRNRNRRGAPRGGAAAGEEVKQESTPAGGEQHQDRQYYGGGQATRYSRQEGEGGPGYRGERRSYNDRGGRGRREDGGNRGYGGGRGDRKPRERQNRQGEDPYEENPRSNQEGGDRPYQRMGRGGRRSRDRRDGDDQEKPKRERRDDYNRGGGRARRGGRGGGRGDGPRGEGRGEGQGSGGNEGGNAPATTE